MMGASELGAFVRQADHDVFRLECLDQYQVESDGGDYARYLAGEPGPDMTRMGPWLDRLRDETERGLRRRRVHILRSPIGDYLRFECEWAYALNAQAGEEIRILDLAERPLPPALTLEDFWVIDGQSVALMHYTGDGEFLGASLVPELERSQQLAAQEAAWATAEPFESWWARHREYHRDGKAA